MLTVTRPCDKCYRRLYEQEMAWEIANVQRRSAVRDSVFLPNSGFVPPLITPSAYWGICKEPEMETHSRLVQYTCRHRYATLKVMQPDGSFREVPTAALYHLSD